jgi:uncharacterized zinc-type alcohol dehydrogenase-like protein
MVPGHEIVGRITRVGAEVTKFKEGDFGGVGCFVDSCRSCSNCSEGFEQFCDKHAVMTYNGTEMDEKTPTYGGYSSQIVMDENYTLKISPEQDLAGVAPLLCAGITTYSPLKRFNVKAGQKVGIVGLGGLGHMGVGAHNFVVTRNPENLTNLAGQFDLILDTVSAAHDLNMYLGLLRRNGVLVLVGVPDKPAEVYAFSLIGKNRMLAGSMIGGIAETQEMLDYCAEYNIVSDVETIPIQKIEEAYERTIKSDVRYRFVIDMQSL